MPKIIFDFDDLHSSYPYNCIETIDYIVDKIPNIKLLFFTVPNLNNAFISNYNKFVDRLIAYINSGNVQIGIHGNTHSTLEFKNISKYEAIEKITSSENILNALKIPFKKIFKGPNWGINQNTIDALVELNYKYIFNHDDYRYLEINNKDNINFVYYNWNLKDNFTLDLLQNEIIVGHGHTHDVCDNGIEQVKDRICTTMFKHKIETFFYS